MRQNKDLFAALTKGLIDAAKTTDAWLITSGKILDIDCSTIRDIWQGYHNIKKSL